MTSIGSPALVVLLVAALASCEGRCGAPDDRAEAGARGDAASAAPCVPLAVAAGDSPAGAPGPSALFVVSGLRFGAADDGLDLDCTRTPDGCVSDFCRDGPEDPPRGTDNRLGPLALRLSKISGTDLQDEMTRATEQGHHPVLVRLIEPTGFRDGTAAAVELSFGLDADGDPSDLTTGRGEVRADPDAPPGRPARFAPVQIRDGVVVAGPSRDWMPFFWTRRQIAAVPVEVAYVRFRIEEPPTGSPPLGGRLSEGLIAGALAPGDLSAGILDLDGRTAKVLTRLGPVVRALVRQQADLDLVGPGPTGVRCEADRECPSGQSCRGGGCREPEERFDAISFAIRFQATSAREVSPTDTAGRDGGSPAAR